MKNTSRDERGLTAKRGAWLMTYYAASARVVLFLQMLTFVTIPFLEVTGAHDDPWGLYVLLSIMHCGFWYGVWRLAQRCARRINVPVDTPMLNPLGWFAGAGIFFTLAWFAIPEAKYGIMAATGIIGASLLIRGGQSAAKYWLRKTIA